MKKINVQEIPSSMVVLWKEKIEEAYKNESSFITFCGTLDEVPLPIVKLLFPAEIIVYFESYIFQNDLLPTDTIDLLANTVLRFNLPSKDWYKRSRHLATYENILMNFNTSREIIMRILEKCDSENFELRYEPLRAIVTRNSLTSEDILKAISRDSDSLSYLAFKDALEAGTITPYEGYQLCLREDLEWQDERRSILLTGDKWYKPLMESLILEEVLEESMKTMPYTWFAKAFKWNIVDV